jgi:hypothetical protein
MTGAEAREYLTGHLAELVGADLLADSDVVRRSWYPLPHYDPDGLRLYLKQYAGPENADMPGVFVTSPAVLQGRTVAGVWRSVRVEANWVDAMVDGRPQRVFALVQTLRKTGGGTTAGFAATRGMLGDADAVLYAEADTPPYAPSPALPGFVYDATATFNAQRGTYDGRLTYDREKAASVVLRSRRTPFEMESMAVYRHAATAPEAPATTIGAYDATVEFSAGGLYNGRLAYSVPVEGGAAVVFAAGRGALQDSDAGVYERMASALVAQPAGPGGTYSANNAIDLKSGTYSGRLVYDMEKAASVLFESRRGNGTLESEAVYRHWPERLVAPDADAAGVYDAAWEFSPGGLYNGRLVYQALLERAFGMAFSDNGSTSLLYGAQQARAVTLPSVPANNRNSVSINFDGSLYSWALTSRPMEWRFGGSSWSDYGQSQIYGVQANGQPIYVSFLRTTSSSAAVDFCNGAGGGSYGAPRSGYRVAISDGGYRTGPRYYGQGRWEATRVDVKETP